MTNKMDIEKAAMSGVHPDQIQRAAMGASRALEPARDAFLSIAQLALDEAAKMRIANLETALRDALVLLTDLHEAHPAEVGCRRFDEVTKAVREALK